MSPSERAAVDQAHRQFGEPTATPKPRAGEHTKGPWQISAPARSDKADDYALYVEIDGKRHIIAECYGRSDWEHEHPSSANARRIVTCVNACEGLPTETLEAAGLGKGILDHLKSEHDLLRERDGEVGKLLKAFAECVETLAFRMEAPNEFTPQFVQLAQSFRAALAKYGR